MTASKEMHVASDLAALVRYTTTVAHLDDDEMATLTAKGFTTYTSRLAATRKAVTELDIDLASYDESDHESNMHKEILEQPAAAERMLRGRRFGTAHLGGLDLGPRETRAIQRVKVFALLALHLGRVRDLSIADGKRLIAEAHSAAESLFFVGRVRGFPVAREGTQKFKEISYRHAEAHPTSELRHGPLALISPDVHTVAIVPNDELTARNVAELDPILLTVPLQLLAYHAARRLGHDIDKPRNLAKSVTVE